MKKRLAIFSVGLLFLGAGCSKPITQPIQPIQPEQSAPPAQQVKTINPEDLAIDTTIGAVRGQKFGEMAYEEVENQVVKFTGSVDVSGKVSLSKSGNLLCFIPDEASLKKLPNIRKNRPAKSFCFSNQAEAKDLLKTLSNRITIKIKGYSDRTTNASELPTTSLVRVVSK